MKILVINCGSSSLKYQLFDMEDESVSAKGLVDRIGIEGSNITHRKTGAEPFTINTPIKDHKVAMKLVLDALLDEKHGVLKSLDEINGAGHRIVSGGDYFKESVLVNDEVMDALRKCIPLAPLHNPGHIMGIEAIQHALPKLKNVIVFDTAFHQTMPDYAYMYGLPWEFYETHRVRRYGAHGTSHHFVALRTAEILGKPLSELKMVTCHLGNGSSISAVKNGKCIDTSMGLTPLAGVLMGTRTGDMDPACVPFVQNITKYSADEMNNFMNKKSGLLGISGVSSDLRDVEEAANNGNERARLAINMLEYGISKYIGAYTVAMGGLDVLVFTAGIGENSASTREAVCKKLEFMGVKIDPAKNNIRGKEAIVSADDSKVKVLVVPTNEELMIARETKRVAFDE
ncbi:MAG: acetate kinase [Synergistaceae bacterium]|nr:acetate kinase [Synergistaceae bacterium]